MTLFCTAKVLKNMINFVISGTIDGEFDFPNDMFIGYCYEGWGNAWCMIDGVQAKYISAYELVNNPSRLDNIDILMAEFGQKELHQLAHQQGVFNIATESGAGFEIDKENTLDGKLNLVDRFNNCSLFLSTTHAGKDYVSMFSATPVLDIPLPMDLNKFYPRQIPKFDEFTVCIGEIIESCYDDRPLQFYSAAIVKSLNMKIAGSIGPQARNFNMADITRLGFEINLYPHQRLFEMSSDYLAKSHVSMMLGQRSTFGRFIYVSWAIGVPCIATRYQCQELICPQLTVGIEETGKIKYLLKKLKSDEKFYRNCSMMGIDNVRQYLGKEAIALRIINEILPVYYC